MDRDPQRCENGKENKQPEYISKHPNRMCSWNWPTWRLLSIRVHDLGDPQTRFTFVHASSHSYLALEDRSSLVRKYELVFQVVNPLFILLLTLFKRFDSLGMSPTILLCGLQLGGLIWIDLFEIVNLALQRGDDFLLIIVFEECSFKPPYEVFEILHVRWKGRPSRLSRLFCTSLVALVIFSTSWTRCHACSPGHGSCRRGFIAGHARLECVSEFDARLVSMCILHFR